MTPDGLVRVTVSDTGIGIADERLAELFQLFSRLGAESTDVEGTGIGLAITKRLVEAMGGRIGVHSTVGEGSRFYFDLPAAEVDDHSGLSQLAEPAEEYHVMHDDERVTSRASRQVLYVEDNTANVRLMEEILAQLPDISLLTAPDARLGIELARAHVPDLLLLDVHLPGMSGLELLRHLRADPATSGIPAIALSADAMQADIDQAIAAGFERYVTKPINIVELLRAVEEFVPAMANSAY
jgi:CheY-like chemotaxis protein